MAARRIAVLGLGLLGQAIALRLRERGHRVVGWNRGAARLAQAEARGLSVQASLPQAIAEADLAVLLLSHAQAINETLAAPGVAEALAGKTLVQMGTIAPSESRELAERWTAQGVDYFEAPVLGSLPEAAAGQLILMVGGSQTQFDAHREWLSDLGADPRWVGAVGQAAHLKLAFNQLIATLTTGFALSLALVRQAGVPVDLFLELLRQSALYAPTFDKKLDRLLSDDFERPNFPLDHLVKDLRLFQTAARDLGLNAEALNGLLASMERVQVSGQGGADYSVLARGVLPPTA